MNIIIDDKQFRCNLINKDDRGFTVVDWLLDVIRYYTPVNSVDLFCNSYTKEMIINCYSEWLGKYKEHYNNYILLNGQIITFQVDNNESDIKLVSRQPTENEKIFYTVMQ